MLAYLISIGKSEKISLAASYILVNEFYITCSSPEIQEVSGRQYVLVLQASALDCPEEYGNNGDHQQCMNEPAGAVTDISDSPKYDQYNSDYIQ
jgi:hypothetical protein